MVVAGLPLAAGALVSVMGQQQAPASTGSNARPNVIVIETDDQTAESARVMENVQKQIMKKGTTFENSFVNFSDCCPSRATFLTGEYAHNHRVQRNRGGFQKFARLHGHNNLAVWLHKAGYRTALVGKYLNGFGNKGKKRVPPGWSRWYAAMKPPQTVYGYNLDVNGSRIVHYGRAVADFKQDVFTRKAVHFVRQAAPSRKPFFLWLTYTAPHNAPPNPNPLPPSDCTGSAKPAPRHAHAFDSEPLPMPPNFNEADVSDKPRQVRRLPRLDGRDITDQVRRYRCQLESLLSVDEGVDAVLDQLRRTGELHRTYVVFTSDNGWFHGEHRIRGGKGMPYEESIRVPLAIRGPGIPQGGTSPQLVVNADLAPTIVQVANARPRLTMDGRSLLPFARHPHRRAPRVLVVEARSFRATRSFKAIRTRRYLYARYRSREKELYDLKRDPFELENVHATDGYRRIERKLARRLRQLKDCSGASCRRHQRL